MKKEEDQSDRDFTARACASTYRVAAGLWTMIFLPALYFVSQHINRTWLLLPVVGFTFVLVLYWVRSFQISISGNTVSYRSLLGGARILQWNEIATAEIKVDTETKVGPVWKLILRPEPSSPNRPVVINMKVFSKADLNRVFEFLGTKLKERRLTATSAEREEMMRNSV